MALILGIQAEHPSAASNKPHILSYATARTLANDTLFEIWNGPTNASRKFLVDLDGKPYSPAWTAGDLLYAVTGGIASVRRLDSLAIGVAGKVLRSDGSVPTWSTATFPNTAVLGDTLYGSAANVWTALTGNITTTRKFLRQTGDGALSAAPAWDTVLAADVPASALTRVDDTNVTLTLGGSPSTALLAAASITAGWTGTLAAGRLNANVVQSVVNDTNVTGSIAAQALTLGWTGTLAAGRLNANVVQSIVNDTNVTGSIAAQALTLGWTGTLAVGRGGTGLSTFTAAGGIAYATAATTLAVLAIGAVNTVMVSTGAAPSWNSTLTSVTLSSPTLSGTVAGTPTWASNQAITLSTAAQPNVTSLGTLTSLTLSGLLLTVASASGGAGFRLPHGAAPSAPTNGDLWTTTLGTFQRVNGTTAEIAAIFAGRPGTTIGPSTTDYLSLASAGGSSPTEPGFQCPAPVAGILRSLYVWMETAQPATGSLVLTVRKNALDTAIVVTIAAGSAAGVYSDTSNAVAVAAGDKLAVKVVNNATGASGSITSITLAIAA